VLSCSRLSPWLRCVAAGTPPLTLTLEDIG
jgi:hypothetical protein